MAQHSLFDVYLFPAFDLVFRQYSHPNFPPVPQVMSTVSPQQPQMMEEEEEEEQGEEFEFEDSTDEEKVQADTKEISSDSVKPVQLAVEEAPLQANTQTQDTSSKTTSAVSQPLPSTSPPAGQEANPSKDTESTARIGNVCSYNMLI